MDVPHFSFEVNCPPEKVTARAFNLAAEAFSQLLSQAEADDWIVTEARIASVHMTAEPLVYDSLANRSLQVMRSFAGMASSAEPNQVALITFKRVIENSNALVHETQSDLILNIDGQISILGQQLLENLERLLKKAARRSFGRIQGKIDKLILQRNHRSIGLVDKSSGRRVKVTFPSDLDGVVSTLNPGRLIEVTGFIRLDADDCLSMDAEGIQTIQKKHRAPVTADDLVNTIKIQLPSGVNSVSIIDSLRSCGEQRITRGDSQ